MTGWANRFRRDGTHAALAAVIALAATQATAQDGQFDLRTRATPTPGPVAPGPVDPDNPAPVRPRAEPGPSAPPPLVVPSSAPDTPSAAAATDGVRAARTVPSGATASSASPAAPRPSGPGSTPLPPTTAASAPATPAANVAPPPASRPYRPRNLDVVAEPARFGLWLGLAALALFLAIAGWLAWSRWFRVRVTALPAPEIERPRVPQPAPEAIPEPANDSGPQPAAAAAERALEIKLEATRMSATLMNTTLSYRLVVTNRGETPLRDIRVDGDMIAAHAERKLDDLFGPYAAVLPELHRIASLAPGEGVTLGGDIRLPLVAITPIRRGDAAFFVPLARLRARGRSPIGLSVEGGGTFLVGQEPGANRKLQPFRLDLGPRNYSNLGQHLLPAA